MIDIHGQHAHQSLLHAAAQRQLLDAYAGLRAEVRELAQLYQSWRSTLDQLASLRQAGDDGEGNDGLWVSDGGWARGAPDFIDLAFG